MTTDFYASSIQYLDHLAPIWLEIPEDHRGEFLARAGSPVADLAKLDYGIETSPPSRGSTRSVVVASFGDLKTVSPRPAVLVEHGAGQTYDRTTPHPSGPGGPGREGVILFIVPNSRVADLNRASYPDTPNAVVGCPKLDRWVGHTPPPGDPVVAVSFRWNCPLGPESVGAFPHYQKHLHRLAREFPGALGHGHPNILPELAASYIRYGLEITGRFDTVLDEAHIYIVDNSSTMFEFAATGRPVVVLNAPWYRRHVDHGLRFWEYADIGVQVDDPANLNSAIYRALEDAPKQAERRRRIVAAVYADLNGQASTMAATAILEATTQ